MYTLIEAETETVGSMAKTDRTKLMMWKKKTVPGWKIKENVILKQK